jgi:hypothetical protein
MVQISNIVIIDTIYFLNNITNFWEIYVENYFVILTTTDLVKPRLPPDASQPPHPGQRELLLLPETLFPREPSSPIHLPRCSSQNRVLSPQQEDSSLLPPP